MISWRGSNMLDNAARLILLIASWRRVRWRNHLIGDDDWRRRYDIDILIDEAAHEMASCETLASLIERSKVYLSAASV